MGCALHQLVPLYRPNARGNPSPAAAAPGSETMGMIVMVSSLAELARTSFSGWRDRLQYMVMASESTHRAGMSRPPGRPPLLPAGNRREPRNRARGIARVVVSVFAPAASTALAQATRYAARHPRVRAATATAAIANTSRPYSAAVSVNGDAA